MAEKLNIPTRDELVRRYERDYQLRMPGALVGEGTLPGTDARTLSDQLLPMYAEASRLGALANIDETFGTDLEDVADRMGLPRRLPAVGASGQVTVQTSVGGATILAGAQLVHQPSGLRYACTISNLYVSGAQVSIAGVDTGPGTNLDPGTVLTWVSPPPGLAPTCTVFASPLGYGLTGGRDAELDVGIQGRIKFARANPAVAGNHAAYRQAMLETPNVAVDQAFVYPAILGPGTIGLAFTVRSETGSRFPSSTERALVLSRIVGLFPADDSIFMCALVAEPLDMVTRVRWAAGAAGWADAVPWPVYSAGNPFTVQASPAPTATTFRVSTAMGSPPAPVIGKTVGVFDTAARKWRRKKILSFTGSGPWDIVVDTTFNASDTSYVPSSGDVVSPWSDSLDSLVAPIAAHIDTLGVGEQVSSFYDYGGVRQRRFPAISADFPADLTGRFLSDIYAVPAVEEVQVASPVMPLSPSVGVPGVTSNLLTLDDVGVYPL